MTLCAGMELPSMSAWYLPLKRGVRICSPGDQEHPNKTNIKCSWLFSLEQSCFEAGCLANF